MDYDTLMIIIFIPLTCLIYGIFVLHIMLYRKYKQHLARLKIAGFQKTLLIFTAIFALQSLAGLILRAVLFYQNATRAKNERQSAAKSFMIVAITFINYHLTETFGAFSKLSVALFLGHSVLSRYFWRFEKTRRLFFVLEKTFWKFLVWLAAILLTRPAIAHFWVVTVLVNIMVFGYFLVVYLKLPNQQKWEEYNIIAQFILISGGLVFCETMNHGVFGGQYFWSVFFTTDIQFNLFIPFSFLILTRFLKIENLGEPQIAYTVFQPREVTESRITVDIK